ncbi:MAG TPA: c-type cytochrome domain-containing protein, partial [Vicinamibacterales bacterium]|nr:c-type cytochrome domain-containing protein [Vicinamibacterales bacterium]
MRDRSPRAFPTIRAMTIGLAGLAFAVSLCVRAGASAELPTATTRAAQSPASAGAVPPASTHRRTLDRYCVTCHNEKLKTAGLMLDVADVANPGAGAEVWEKVVRKMRTSTMPPPNM